MSASEKLQALRIGPWKYGGMIGDPGKPLRHFVKDEDGEPILFSDDFAADYANLDRPLKTAVALVNALPQLVALVEAAEKQDRLRGGEHTPEDSSRAFAAIHAALADLDRVLP